MSSLIPEPEHGSSKTCDTCKTPNVMVNREGLCTSCRLKRLSTGRPPVSSEEWRAIQAALELHPDAQVHVRICSGGVFDPRWAEWSLEVVAVDPTATPYWWRCPWDLSADPDWPDTLIPVRVRWWRPDVQGHLEATWDSNGDAVSLRITPKTRSPHLTLLTKLMDMVIKRVHTGRPRGTGTFKNAEEFKKVVILTIRELYKQGKHVSQASVAGYLANAYDRQTGEESKWGDRQMRVWCTRYGVTWDALVAEALTGISPHTPL
jgi:hypothetical protein